MAKLSPLLTTGITAGVVGGLLIWYFAVHRDDGTPAGAHSAAGTEANAGESTAGPSSQAQPIGEGSTAPSSGSGIDDSLTYAIEAADPYVKEGFTIREDYWGGDLPVKEAKAIVQQLFKGNSYWFWIGTDKDGAKITVHVYDSSGLLVDAESWQKPHKAAARVVPQKTGSYYLIIEVEKSPAERTPWAMGYGFQ